MITIRALHEQVGEAEARERVQRVVGTPDVHLTRKIYYPYFAFRFSASVPALLMGRRPVSACCLIDAIGGQGIVADALDWSAMEIDGGDRLETAITADEARRAAGRYLESALQRRFRALATFEIRLEAENDLHKAFWIAEVEDSRALVDSVSGELHLLA